MAFFSFPFFERRKEVESLVGYWFLFGYWWREGVARERESARPKWGRRESCGLDGWRRRVWREKGGGVIYKSCRQAGNFGGLNSSSP